MIKELVQFTKSISDLKDIGLKPKDGLYIQLMFENNDGQLSLKLKQAEVYTSKKSKITPFFELCAKVIQNNWMVDTNKCFDLPSKGIHSCSPYCVAFKREALPTLSKIIIERKVEELAKDLIERSKTELIEKQTKELKTILENTGEKFKENEDKRKLQLTDRLNSYFDKALSLIDDDRETGNIGLFSKQSPESSEKLRLLMFRDALNSLEKINLILECIAEYEDLKDADYVVFFLDISIDDMLIANQKYLKDKLFNTNEFNSESDKELYGTSNFFNGFGTKKSFLTHQSATFSIAGRISTSEAQSLYNFNSIIGRKILPNPLPIFIYEDEQKLALPILKSNANEEPEKRMGYQEIIKKILDAKKLGKGDDSIGNYYLLFFSMGKIKDFDFVSRFDFELKDCDDSNWKIEPLFSSHFKIKIHTVFDFQSQILPKIFNNALVVNTKVGGQIYKFFDDIDSEYCKTANTYLMVMKYRKAFYDFIYKSQRSAISQIAFEDILLTLILDDIKKDKFEMRRHSEELAIKEKLNILFSLHSNFQPFYKNYLFMPNQTISLREFVIKLSKGEVTIQTDVQFAFAAGQVIAYLFTKTRSDDRSYSRLESFLQHTDVSQLQNAIVAFFSRYKHEKYSRNFKFPFSEVTGYQTTENLRKYNPLILSGFFSNNLLFADKSVEPEIEDEEVSI